MEQTFGMIKPEGMIYKNDILERIVASGLEISAMQELVLNETQFESIYGQAKNHIPRVFEDMRTYMTTRPVVVLKISGENASRQLLKLRGASNPCESEPGTIRGDYAKDQDYRVLYKRGQFAKNVFHACEADEAEKMMQLFFGGIL